MAEETPPETQTVTPTSRCRCRRFVIGFLVVLIGALVADGSRCVPADATTALVIHESTKIKPPDASILRLATFNIHSGKGTDRRVDLERTARVLGSPDVVGLNEVRGSFWSDPRLNQASQLGGLLHMNAVFLPTERRWWHDHFGNGLLTKLPVGEIHRIPLIGTRGKAFRAATLTSFEFQQKEIQLLTVHVDSQTDRERQLRAVISLFQGLQSPAILMGDLNTTSDNEALKRLLALPDVVDVLADQPPDTRGRQHIDWILARGFRCRSGRLIENDASDHPAVTAELELLPE
jgi:endonuclease/exonuclease/phosphatase family metal-dependent hydrolase